MWLSFVVYFDQRTHACACICMVENNQKHSKIRRLGVNQLLGVTPNPWPTTFFFVFLREPLLSLSCAWWKRYFFTHFRVFLIVFDHADACASMRSLVEIHNRHYQSLVFIIWLSESSINPIRTPHHTFHQTRVWMSKN